MASIVHSIKFLGKKHNVTLRDPSNEEYNAYAAQIDAAIKAESDELLNLARVKQFDLWCEKVEGRDKAAVPDRMKASIMFKVYEQVEVDEKN